MTPRTVSILALLCILSVGAAVYGIAERVSFQTTNFEGQRVFPDLLETAGDVARVKLTQSGDTMTFVREGERWTLVESGGYPVHGNLIAKAIFATANLELLEAKTALPARHGALDLNDPAEEGSQAQRLVLEKADGTVMADLIVGRANFFLPKTTTGGIYIRMPGDDQSWLARGLLDLGTERRDWLVRDIVDIEPKRIASVDVTQPDGAKLIVRPKDGVTGGFEFVNMPEGRKLSNEFAPRNVAAVLNGFILNDARRASDVAREPANTYVADYMTKDGIRVVLDLWRKDETQYMSVDAEYTGSDPDSGAAKEAAEIVERTRGWVYIVPEYQYEQIAKKMSDVTEEIKPDS